MPILNYTTEVPAAKTVGQIYEILASCGASEITFEHAQGEVVAVKFCIIHEDQPLAFRLAPDPEGVLRSMVRDKAQPRYQKPAQAHRVAWRIMKDAIEAQMAIFQTQQGDLAQVFLPYAIDGKGKTVYQVFSEGRRLQLKAKA